MHGKWTAEYLVQWQSEGNHDFPKHGSHARAPRIGRSLVEAINSDSSLFVMITFWKTRWLSHCQVLSLRTPSISRQAGPHVYVNWRFLFSSIISKHHLTEHWMGAMLRHISLHSRMHSPNMLWHSLCLNPATGEQKQCDDCPDKPKDQALTYTQLREIRLDCHAYDLENIISC